MTYRCDTQGTVLHQDSGPSSMKLDSGLRLIPPSSRQALPYPGPKLHQTRKLRHSTSSVMLAMPSNAIRGRLVHSKTKWRFILPHLSCHVVPPFPTHWQNGFQLLQVRTTSWTLRSSIPLSLRHFSAGPMEFRKYSMFNSSNRASDNKKSTPSKRDSILMASICHRDDLWHTVETLTNKTAGIHARISRRSFPTDGDWTTLLHNSCQG